MCWLNEKAGPQPENSSEANFGLTLASEWSSANISEPLLKAWGQLGDLQEGGKENKQETCLRSQEKPTHTQVLPTSKEANEDSVHYLLSFE